MLLTLALKQAISGVSFEARQVVQAFGIAGEEERGNEMINLFKEFKDWIAYNFPGEELDEYQSAVVKAIFNEQVPSNSKELAQRLKELLPKARK